MKASKSMKSETLKGQLFPLFPGNLKTDRRPSCDPSIAAWPISGVAHTKSKTPDRPDLQVSQTRDRRRTAAHDQPVLSDSGQ